MKRSDFDYDLPPDLIAQQPRPRGGSRMLVVQPRLQGPPELSHHRFADITRFLGAGDVLVINDTRVIPARLFARPKGQMKRAIEVLLTREVEPLRWQALCRPARRVRQGDVLTFSDALTARVIRKEPDGSLVLLFESQGLGPAVQVSAFLDEIEKIGAAPLPPYIHRETPSREDRDSYQTVYAAEPGAVAAPTAGLHFTVEILETLAAKGVEIIRVTLHVGLGTFQPVKVESLQDHRMQSERYSISARAADQVNAAMREGRRIIAVGTTSVRTLESAIRECEGSLREISGDTSLFITPGFEFQVVTALLTNFHLPESTLIMLVSAFAGVSTTRAAYVEAIREGYLFYSYGDCMLVLSAEC